AGEFRSGAVKVLTASLRSRLSERRIKPTTGPMLVAMSCITVAMVFLGRALINEYKAIPEGIESHQYFTAARSKGWEFVSPDRACIPINFSAAFIERFLRQPDDS